MRERECVFEGLSIYLHVKVVRGATVLITYASVKRLDIMHLPRD